MYRVQSFDISIWLVCLALEVFLLLRLRANRVRIAFFPGLIAFCAARSAILCVTAGLFGYSAYYTAFAVTSILAALFEIGILIEVLNSLKRWSTVPPETVRICLLLCVALAVCLTGMNFSIDAHSSRELYLTVNRMTALMQAAVFVTVVLFSALWGMSWQRDSGIISGFGFATVVQLAVATRFSGMPQADAILARVYILGHLTCLIAWAWTLGVHSSQPGLTGRGPTTGHEFGRSSAYERSPEHLLADGVLAAPSAMPGTLYPEDSGHAGARHGAI